MPTNQQTSTSELDTLLFNKISTDLSMVMEGSKENFSPADRKTKTIAIVNDLLTRLLDSESSKLIQDILKSQGANSLGVSGVGSNTNNNMYYPSFNIRTPIVELYINKAQIYPNKFDLGTQKLVPTKMNFQSFNLSMPLGGVEKTITGTLTLFTKNPQEILQSLDIFGNGSTTVNFTTGGLPVVDLKFGWAFNSSTSDTISKALSPTLHFLVTNVAMSDPSSVGTTFTLSLQELGSTILQYSTDDLLLDPDYPQQQLRALLEGFLHIRLFTLDDILYLNQYNSGKSPDISTAQTFFTTDKLCSIGIGNRTFFTVANELASLCRCQWYPHSNVDTSTQNAKTESSNAFTYANTLANDLKMIKGGNNTTLTTDQASELSNTLSNSLGSFKGKITDKTSVDAAKKILTGELQSSIARLSTKSILFWVPNVPASWKTSGSDFYNNNRDGEAPSPYPEGAFFLLPDILDNYDIFTQDIPVQYGPGASSMPYFYGSGQNVLQESISNGTTIPKLFGEVISISTNHSTMIATLATAADENLAYGVNGKRLNQLEAASFAINKNVSSEPGLQPDSSQIQIDQQAQKDRTAKIAKTVSKSAKAQLNSWYKGAIGIGANGALAMYEDTTLRDKDKSLPYADPGGPSQSAFYAVKSRVSSFLRWPTQVKISILGDPNLLRLGPGCFELFSYYPVEHDNGTVTQDINALTSGLYFVEGIEHSISGGEFITILSGSKIIDPINAPSSITNTLLTKASNAVKLSKKPQTLSNQNSVLSGNQLSSVDLNSPDFKTGLIATELSNIFAAYQNTAKH